MQQPVQILLIEDNPLFVELVRRMLAEGKIDSFSLEAIDTLAAGMSRLSEGGVDAVLLDLTLPDSTGLETFTRLRASGDGVPTVIFTSVDDEELSLSALSHGAADYLVKSEVNAAWLARSLIYAIQRNQPAQLTENVDNTDNAADANSVGELAEVVPEEAAIDTQQSTSSESRWVVTPCE